MIYFVQAEGVGNIKIGFTDSVDASDRLSTLQTGSPVPLRLLGTIPGTMDDEKDLHRRFASARVVGEWFKPVSELLALIAPADPLICGKVEVVEKSVQIRVLTVGRKQFTKVLFDQLPTDDLINWLDVWSTVENEGDLSESQAFEDGSFWGWVDTKYQSNSGIRSGPFVIFERDARLWKSLVLSSLSSSDFPGNTSAAIKKSMQQFWSACVLRWTHPSNQLFIGV